MLLIFRQAMHIIKSATRISTVTLKITAREASFCYEQLSGLLASC